MPCFLGHPVFTTKAPSGNNENLKIRSKEYKKEINKSILQYKRSMLTKVRQMQHKSPKNFWNYVNLNSKPEKRKLILMFCMLFFFFKPLNSTEHNDVLDGEVDANNYESDMLNSDITEE